MKKKAKKVGRPKTYEDAVFCGFQLPASLRDAVDEYAERKGLTRSAAIVLLLETSPRMKALLKGEEQ